MPSECSCICRILSYSFVFFTAVAKSIFSVLLGSSHPDAETYVAFFIIEILFDMSEPKQNIHPEVDRNLYDTHNMTYQKLEHGQRRRISLVLLPIQFAKDCPDSTICTNLARSFSPIGYGAACCLYSN